MVYMSGGKAARNAASITNRANCGGNKKGGLMGGIGSVGTGGISQRHGLVHRGGERIARGGVGGGVGVSGESRRLGGGFLVIRLSLDDSVRLDDDVAVGVGRLDVGHLFSHYGASRRSGYVSPAGCFTPSGAAWCAYVALGFCRERVLFSLIHK